MIILLIHRPGSKCWYRDYQIHRLNGPADISSGFCAWWVNNDLHRLDGPARIWSDGTHEFWINGHQVTEYEHMFLTAQEAL